MVDATQITEHSEVVGSDGEHVGVVDHLEGTDQIKLARQDAEAGGEHHYIPVSFVASVDGNRVQLNKTAAEAKSEWTTGGQSSGASV